jgi:hypothetical protein
MKTIDFDYVKQILNANGITDEVLAENDNSFESGTEEWMLVISDIIGRDAFGLDEFDIAEDEHNRILEFISVMNQNGITSW